MTETRWERRFYELYFASAFQQAHRRAHQVLETALADPVSAGLPTDVGSEEWAQSVWRDLVVALTVPALLPQVVLNFAGTADLPPGHPGLQFFEGNVARVDFAFVHQGERHIVEVDDAIRRASEKSYASRLRVERSLRHQEWHVHRFSSLEVREAEDFEEFKVMGGTAAGMRALMRMRESYEGRIPIDHTTPSADRPTREELDSMVGDKRYLEDPAFRAKVTAGFEKLYGTGVVP